MVIRMPQDAALDSTRYYWIRRSIMIKKLLLAFLLGLSPALTPLTLHADEVAVANQVQTININKADAATLTQGLKGVGRTRAEAIVEYRSAYGPFFSVDDLLEVKGVGPSIVDKNRARITLE
jgi:competence protein ComEA